MKPRAFVTKIILLLSAAVIFTAAAFLCADAMNAEYTGRVWVLYAAGMLSLVLYMFSLARRTFSSTSLPDTDNISRLLPCGVCRTQTDKKLTIIIANSFFYELFGYTPEEAAGARLTSAASFLCPTGDEDDLARLNSFGGKVYASAEFCTTKSDGGSIWVLVRSHRCDGEIFLAVFDITDRKRAEDALRVSEEECRIAVAQGGKYIARYDPAADTIHFPADAAKLFDCPENVSGIPDTILQKGRVCTESAEDLKLFCEAMKRGEPNGCATLRLVTSEGEVRWFRFNFTVSCAIRDAALQCVVSFSDVTALREKELAYEKWQQTYQSMPLESMNYYEYNLSIGTFDREQGGMLPPVPESVERSLSAVTRHISENHTDPNSAAHFVKFFSMERLIASYEHGLRCDSMDYLRKSGTELLWTQASIQMVPDPYSNDIKCFVLLKDIDAAKRAELMVSTRSQQDPLTGLLNRTAFIEQMSAIIAASAPGAEHALIMIDIDRFKRINDTFGHHFGDQVLCDIASSLRSTLRTNDIVGRIGGDEFVVCLRDLPPDRHVLERRACFICDLLEKNYGGAISVSGSIGIAMFPDDGADFDALYQRADKALYHAKRLGKHCYVTYSPELDAAPGNVSATPIDSSAENTSAPTINLTSRFNSSTRRMLVADDSETTRTLFSELFRGEYDVLEASNGAIAMELLKKYQNSIAVVLLDLLMPEKSGLEMLEEMRRDAALSSIPALAFSSADEMEYSAKAIGLGAVDFIHKPVDPALVKLRVSNAVTRRELDDLRSSNRLLLLQKEQETRSNANLLYLAEHDPLTDLYNKSAFLRAISEKMAVRTNVSYTLCYIDVDRLRVINEIFGHDEGDRLLRRVAGLIHKQFFGVGIFARIESDDFAILVPGGPDDAKASFDRLCAALSGYDLPFEVMLNCGAFSFSGDSIAPEQGLERARMACKAINGNFARRFSLYSEDLAQATLEEKDIVGQMRLALEGGQFTVWFQPKYSLETGKVVGAEALVRWNHPERGIIIPGTFIPIFEKNGFIMQMDAYIWESVCRLLRKWLDVMPDDRVVPVSVNISRADIYSPSLCATLADLAKKYSLPPGLLTLEVTETSYTDEPELLESVITKLQKNGFSVEIGGFGRGYSSLFMLKELSADFIKLDMRFLCSPDDGARGESILTSVLRLSDMLSLPVIAEGVETAEQAAFLQNAGCKVAQGYYFHRPMPATEFEDLIVSCG